MKGIQLHIVLVAALIVLSWKSVAQGRLSGAANQFSQRSSSSSNTERTPQGIKEIFPPRERDWKPSMLRISYDAIAGGVSVFDDYKRRTGFQAAMDFDQYFLAVEYGTESSERGDGFGYQYEAQGNYFSVGPEVNLLKNVTDGSILTFGLRYGQANFSDQLTFSVDSTFFGDYDVSAANPDLIARWMEMTMHLSTEVWKNLTVGYTVRYKVARKVKNIGVMAPYDVPGFGLYEDNTGVRLNFYIGWVFRWREKELLEEKK